MLLKGDRCPRSSCYFLPPRGHHRAGLRPVLEQAEGVWFWFSTPTLIVASLVRLSRCWSSSLFRWKYSSFEFEISQKTRLSVGETLGTSPVFFPKGVHFLLQGSAVSCLIFDLNSAQWAPQEASFPSAPVRVPWESSELLSPGSVGVAPRAREFQWSRGWRPTLCCLNPRQG